MSGRKLAGFQVKSSLGMNTSELDLNGIEPGLYFVMLSLDGRQELKKLVIE
jgi:hypothetical protein